MASAELRCLVTGPAMAAARLRAGDEAFRKGMDRQFFG